MNAPVAPPGPRGSLLLGSARDLQRDQLGTYERVMRDHGDLVRFRIGPPRLGFEFDAVFTPEGAHQVLAADARRYEKDAPVYRELSWAIGNGLLTNDGDRWRRHRRIVQPLFTRRRVTDHAGAVTAAAADLVASWRDDVRAGHHVDLHRSGTRYALQVLGRAVFGDDVETASPTLGAAIPALSAHVARRGLAAVRSPAWLPTPANQRAESARRALWGLVDELIARRRDEAGEGSGDLLDLLLAARDPEDDTAFDDDAVRDEALVFLIAGHDTTSAALAFALHLLARHPAVQDRVRDEVTAMVGGRPVEGGDVDALPFTSQVVAESLRLYPLGHTIVRRASEETTLLDHPIAAGRIVAVSVWGIHRNPAVWPDPDRFDPDRFAPERSGSRHRYAHLPFGGGPRSCIGEPLAMLELVVAVAAVVQAYRLDSPVASPPLDVGLTLRPAGSLPCRATPIAGLPEP